MTRARIEACGSASAIAGRVSARMPAKKPSSQPGKPPAENQRRPTANSRTSSIANQKFGTATPSWVTPMIATSVAVLRRAAAMMPAGKAMRMVSVSA